MIIFLDIRIKTLEFGASGECKSIKTKNIDCFTTTYAFLTLII